MTLQSLRDYLLDFTQPISDFINWADSLEVLSKIITFTNFIKIAGFTILGGLLLFEWLSKTYPKEKIDEIKDEIKKEGEYED